MSGVLNVHPTNNKSELDRLSRLIYNKDFEYAVGFVLYLDMTPIGLSRLVITEDVSQIISVGVVEPERKKGYGDFLTRSLMNVLCQVSKEIHIAYKDDYFLKFGFTEDKDGMRILTNKLNFPRLCEE